MVQGNWTRGQIQIPAKLEVFKAVQPELLNRTKEKEDGEVALGQRHERNGSAG